MFEKALSGNRNYWTWLVILVGLIFVGFLFWLRQFNEGLHITGMSRDVSWGFYIAQFVFLVGVAASAVMVVLPYYLHNYKRFGKITVLGEFLAVGACIMCMAFIFVDMGQPFRITNVFFYASPHSMMFWDTVVLFGYLILNLVISWVSLGAERKSVAPPKWIKPFIYLSIPWAVSIHTVTAFLYSGLSARPFWMTAVLAPRFLASAFAAGPSLLIILCLLLRKVSNFHVDKESIQKLAIIVCYAMCLNVFLILMEIFTAMYSAIPEHTLHIKYMYFGLGDKTALVPWIWTSVVLAVLALILIINPKTRKNEKVLAFTTVIIFLSIWIDKGMGMVVTGMVPSPLGTVTEYTPTFPEVMITIAVYAVGALIVTVLYKIGVSVKRSAA